MSANETGIHLGGRMFMVREIRPYNAFKAAMIIARYIRKSEPAMLLVIRWLAAREQRDTATMVRMAGELFDLVQEDLDKALEDIFPLLELSTAIPQDFLREEPTVKELFVLVKTVARLNDLESLLGLARDISKPTADRAAVAQAEAKAETKKAEAPKKAKRAAGGAIAGEVYHVEGTRVDKINV